MTLATFITPADFDALASSAFSPEVPVVKSSESDLGEALQPFASAAEMSAKVAQCLQAGIPHFAIGLWYPSMRGHIVERRIEFDPPRNGKTFRYSFGGWGVIHVHVYVSGRSVLQCRVTVNSQARARSREARYPELGPVSDWEWTVVERHAFNLTRRLSTMGRTGPVVQASAAAD